LCGPKRSMALLVCFCLICTNCLCDHQQFLGKITLALEFRVSHLSEFEWRLFGFGIELSRFDYWSHNRDQQNFDWN